VGGVVDVDLHRTDAGDTGPGDLAVGDGLLEDDELALVVILVGRGTLQGHAVLELVKALGGRDDRRVDAEHVEAIAVGPAVVADVDDGGLAEKLLAGGFTVVATVLVRPSRIDERIVGLRRDPQWFA